MKWGTPEDMVSTPPEGCTLRVGSRVRYTNSYGVSFILIVRGFTAQAHYPYNRTVYLHKASWWYPVPADSCEELN